MQPLYSVTTCWNRSWQQPNSPQVRPHAARFTRSSMTVTAGMKCVFIALQRRDILHQSSPCCGPKRGVGADWKRCDGKLNKALCEELWKTWFLNLCQSEKEKKKHRMSSCSSEVKRRGHTLTHHALKTHTHTHTVHRGGAPSPMQQNHKALESRPAPSLSPGSPL